MTAYYGINRPVLSSASMDVTHRVPDSKYSSTLAADMRQQLSTPNEPHMPACCIDPQPCKTWVQFKPEFSQCPTTFVTWKEATGGQVNGFEIGQKDSRIWVASLNDLQYRRGLVSGAQWEAESTRPHIRNRQIFAQYLQSTLYPNSSPDVKRIDRVADSYGALLHQYGKPQYTSF
jgi:hypothetical protein